MDWNSRAARLADHAAGPVSRWHGPLASAPRHLLVPRWWQWQDGRWTLCGQDIDPDRWTRAAYEDRTLVTSVGGQHADHARPEDDPGKHWPTSSSTLPSLVVRMYRHARITETCDVLDVGTGSGYGTALLCRRLSERQVTSVDVDPYLIEAATGRLDAIGLHPALAAVDATGPLPGEPGEFDRIVSMVSVSPLPVSWLTALRTGGRLVTVLARTSMIVTAWKTEDGGAVGTTARDWAGFMLTRQGGSYPPDLVDRFDTEGEKVTTGRFPVLNVNEAWEVRSMLEMLAPHTECSYRESQDGQRTAYLMHPDGSWARATAHRFEPPEVHQGGPRRLWSVLESIRMRLNTSGGLPVYGVPLTITPDGAIHLKRGQWAATIG